MMKTHLPICTGIQDLVQLIGQGLPRIVSSPPWILKFIKKGRFKTCFKTCRSIGVGFLKGKGKIPYFSGIHTLFSFSLPSPLYQGNTLSHINVVSYPHWFLTAYKSLWRLPLLAGTLDPKNPDLYYSCETGPLFWRVGRRCQVTLVPRLCSQTNIQDWRWHKMHKSRHNSLQN